MNPVYLLKTQKLISEIDLEEARATSEKILAQTRISSIAEILNINND
jgi:hypothetical protein